MEKITKYFSCDYHNDTTIEYTKTGLYSGLTCSFTSEDPAYGTDTLHYNSEPAESIEVLSYEMLQEITQYLDCRDSGDEPPRELELVYGEYSNSTLIAIEKALQEIVGDFHPTKWYMTILNASKMIAKALHEDRTKVFAFSESCEEEAKGDPENHKDTGGWFGIKRIDGFFDNEPEEFIIAVGHYGGGGVAFGYADFGMQDEEELANIVCDAISTGMGLDPTEYLYVEEEKHNE